MSSSPEKQPLRFSPRDMLFALFLVAIAAVFVWIEIGFLAIIAGLISVIIAFSIVEVIQETRTKIPMLVSALLLLALIIVCILAIPWE